MRRSVPSAPVAIAASVCLVPAAHAEFIEPILTIRTVEASANNPGIGQDSDSRTTLDVGPFNESVLASAVGQDRIASASASQNSRVESDRIVFSGAGTLTERLNGGPEVTTAFRSEGLIVFELAEQTNFTLLGGSENAPVNLRLFTITNETLIETETVPGDAVVFEGSLAPGQYQLFYNMFVGNDPDPVPDESFTFAASYSLQFVVPAPTATPALLGLLALRRRR
ncbi:MAG: hypothetical protein AAGK04_07700 [Planctomycetota bacterium]